MPVMNGFELLQEIPKHGFEIIFVTAYNHYAMKAIRFSALDYLLKPVDKDELRLAVNRFIEKRNLHQHLQQQYQNFLQNLDSSNKETYKLAISTCEGVHFILPKEIIRCEAEDSYTQFYLMDNKFMMSSKVLKEYDEMLSEHDLIRVHRTHLVNRSYIKSISGDHHLLMSDNSVIEISRRKWDDVKKALLD
jgi:two-component system LytT family response regulator